MKMHFYVVTAWYPNSPIPFVHMGANRDLAWDMGAVAMSNGARRVSIRAVWA